ncbi:N-(5'-phosphoribosyl)anthranilate isomerase [Bacteroidia bacterium]|nr:N-(5'-phosphoribosyl)anthranilate isomerase [Bacteroidia bacterium]
MYKIKVCGMKCPENITEISQLPIDMLGLIFHEKSPRYAGNLDPEALQSVPASIQKVGVFVNASQETVLETIKKYDLQLVQLHGMESPVFCKELKKKGITVIKAFPVEEEEDLKKTVFYEGACDYFLFDTKTSQYGGSGQTFDWQILSAYSGKTPFFLSGGIGIKEMEAVKAFRHPLLYAVDLNSKFEMAPGVKDPDKLKKVL